VILCQVVTRSSRTKKEQLRDAEDQYKKLQSGEQNDGKEFVESMFKDCEN